MFFACKIRNIGILFSNGDFSENIIKESIKKLQASTLNAISILNTLQEEGK